MKSTKVRKTIALPHNILNILSRKAEALGVSVVEYIRFLAVREADTELSMPRLSLETEKNLDEALQDARSGKLQKFAHSKDAMAFLES